MQENRFEQYVLDNFDKQFTFNKHITVEKVTFDGINYTNVNYVKVFDIVYLGQVLITVNGLDKTGNFKSVMANKNITADCIITQINLLNKLLPNCHFTLTRYGKKRLEEFYNNYEITGEYNY